MSILKLRNINTCADFARMSASPLPDGSVLFFADGTRCPTCNAIVRCDPEPLANGSSFRLICQSCHRDIVCVE